SHAYITIHTFGYITASAALQQSGMPTSILKKNNLLLSSDSLGYIFQQGSTKIAAHLVLSDCLCYIDDFRLRQLCISKTLQQLDQAIFICLGIVITLYRRCC